jgi:hypothetical protein
VSSAGTELRSGPPRHPARRAPHPTAAASPWQTVPRSPLHPAGSAPEQRERPGLPGDLSTHPGRTRAARHRPPSTTDFHTTTHTTTPQGGAK